MPLDVLNRHIFSAEDFYHAHPQHPEHTPAEVVVFRFWRHGAGVSANMRGQMKGPWPTDILSSPVAEAYVNHGRWMVNCPFGCRSAQHASRGDHRFFCIECDSGGTSSWVRVNWPDEAELAAIEAALGVRPQIPTRNWLTPNMRAALHQAPETAADLMAENEAQQVA